MGAAEDSRTATQIRADAVTALATCDALTTPISHCITHHIHWWSRSGPTNLTNGVLLCVRCHTQIHHDGWDIEVDANKHARVAGPRVYQS